MTISTKFSGYLNVRVVYCIPILIKKVMNACDYFKVFSTVIFFSNFSSFRFKLWKFSLPIANYMGLEANDFAHLL